MTAAKIIAMAIMLTNPTTVLVYNSVKDTSFEELINNNVGVFGEIDIVKKSEDKPNWKVQ